MLSNVTTCCRYSQSLSSHEDPQLPSRDILCRPTSRWKPPASEYAHHPSFPTIRDVNRWELDWSWTCIKPSRQKQQPGPEQQRPQETPTEKRVCIILHPSQTPAAILFHSAILGLSPQQQTMKQTSVEWIPEIVTTSSETIKTPTQHPRMNEAPAGWIPPRVVTPKQDRTESTNDHEDNAFNASATPFDSILLDAFRQGLRRTLTVTDISLQQQTRT